MKHQYSLFDNVFQDCFANRYAIVRTYSIEFINPFLFQSGKQ